MRICILGKYPPIEGGVSAQTYWLARGLAGRGHAVHVVTNADEVEDIYRLTIGADDGAPYQPSFDSGGFVRVYNACPFDPRTMGHIPAGNPFVSKLAALATDTIRAHDCEIVLAYYFEPYAVAGWLASRWTGRKLVVKHAGSDLDRLFRVPDLATTYREILVSADAIVTQPRLMPRFVGLGVDRSRLQADIVYGLSGAFSGPGGPRRDLSGDGGEGAGGAQPRTAAPIVGIYGKIGVAKGTFDLVEALGRLAKEGTDFRLAAMIGQAQGEILQPALRRAGIADRVQILPMAANWAVPSFLRACTLVCFLERDFPVVIHGPIVPREVLACGTCLVLSAEIASKQRYRDSLLDRENVLVAQDPQDHAALAATLKTALASPDAAAAIGRRGGALSKTIEDHDAFLHGWERLLRDVIEGAEARPSVSFESGSNAHEDAFIRLVPHLHAYLYNAFPDLVNSFDAASMVSDPPAAAIAFCDFAAAGLSVRSTETRRDRKLAAVLAYARVRLEYGEAPIDGAAPFPICDRLQGRAVSESVVGALRPVKGASARVETFEYDVSSVGLLASVGGGPAGDDVGADLDRLEPERTMVLFHRAPNLSPCELRIDEATRDLLRRCDGTRTTATLVEEMAGTFVAETLERQAEVAAAVIDALGRLHRHGVLVFGEFRPGWGWTGGMRGRTTVDPPFADG